MAKTTEEIIAQEKKKIGQAKARIQEVMAKENQAARKLDTRRKIILGGLLMDAAEKEPNWHRALEAILKRVSRENDKKAFEGYTPPLAPEASQALPSQPTQVSSHE